MAALKLHKKTTHLRK